ncbi:unnamed protein product [Rotaria magnacalcarata]|uniref:Uncharacterized protein n=2 Tax=Rotaria magnacalcarata TaxID=392030 RepID=A0A814XI78_9BILA|nr:unnamed protein product [Rotaria magnacalcarata]CAF1602857.1 unnamed protein product [Rotaria magnacalcarata]CAF2009903.1 unnamed protein product [Rotaria magnacalcarata]CAF2056634.1 unnamed protein product [Rotaria magnacalcarata]CAF5041298.1 unnamed protein product [Rotaria magnacalcarata]
MSNDMEFPGLHFVIICTAFVALCICIARRRRKAAMKRMQQQTTLPHAATQTNRIQNNVQTEPPPPSYASIFGESPSIN